MISALQKAKERQRFGQGESNAAQRRREESQRAVVHSGRPGQTITMSDGRRYLVAQDGSFRSIDKPSSLRPEEEK